MSNEIMTVKEAARYLTVTPSTIYRLTAAKKIPFYRPFRRRLMFRKEDLDDWLKTKISPVQEPDKIEQL